MLIAFAVLAIASMLTFEIARLFGTYDYRSFFKKLIGRGWIAFEVLFITTFVIVVGVLASAAGNICRDFFNISYLVGVIGMLAIVGVLAFFGREVVVKALAYKALFLFACFCVLLAAAFALRGNEIAAAYRAARFVEGWNQSGFKYGAYNLVGIPVLLYIARVFRTRREVVVSGAICGLLILLPGALFQIVFMGFYPGIVTQPIPVYWVMEQLQLGWFVPVYSVMLMSSLIDSGAGGLQGINERIDCTLIEKGRAPLSRRGHILVAAVLLPIGAGASQFGIVSLVRNGFGALSWGLALVYLLPLLTVGVWRIVTYPRQKRAHGVSRSA